MVVVDTSVLVKWFLPEAESELALRLRQAHLSGASRIAIPDFALIELGNVLRYKFAAKDEELSTGGVRTLSSMGVQIVATSPELVSLAVRLAYAQEISVYDALFVGMAQEMGMDLLTADELLARRCKNLSFVRLLRDWNPPQSAAGG